MFGTVSWFLKDGNIPQDRRATSDPGRDNIPVLQVWPLKVRLPITPTKVETGQRPFTLRHQGVSKLPGKLISCA